MDPIATIPAPLSPEQIAGIYAGVVSLLAGAITVAVKLLKSGTASIADGVAEDRRLAKSNDHDARIAREGVIPMMCEKHDEFIGEFKQLKGEFIQACSSIQTEQVEARKDIKALLVGVAEINGRISSLSSNISRRVEK